MTLKSLLVLLPGILISAIEGAVFIFSSGTSSLSDIHCFYVYTGRAVASCIFKGSIALGTLILAFDYLWPFDWMTISFPASTWVNCLFLFIFLLCFFLCLFKWIFSLMWMFVISYCFSLVFTWRSSEDLDSEETLKFSSSFSWRFSSSSSSSSSGYSDKSMFPNFSRTWFWRSAVDFSRAFS